MSLRPNDPSISVYAPVTSLYISGPGIVDLRGRGTIGYGPGLAYVEGNRFKYDEDYACIHRSLSIPLRDFQSAVTIQTGTCLDTGALSTATSYTCWPCQGCADGAVDAMVLMSDQAAMETGTCLNCTSEEMVRGRVIRLTLTMPNHQEFAEKLNAEIRRFKNI